MVEDRILVSDGLNEEDALFRYMPLAQFISMIEYKQLFLKKVKLWDDPWEAPDDQLPMIMDDGKLVNADSMIVQSTVGQCWTCEKDSDAMWRIYSNDKQGVMIETSVKNFDLVKNIRRASLSKVIYFNTENYIEKRREIAKNPSYPFGGDMLFKREAFKHEHEVRFLVNLQSYMNDMGNEIWEIPVVGFDVEPEIFLKSITFDPRAEEWFVETMKKYCASKNLKCHVEKSVLYEKNFFESAKIYRKYEIIK